MGPFLLNPYRPSLWRRQAFFREDAPGLTPLANVVAAVHARPRFPGPRSAVCARFLLACRALFYEFPLGFLARAFRLVGGGEVSLRAPVPEKTSWDPQAKKHLVFRLFRARGPGGGAPVRPAPGDVQASFRFVNDRARRRPAARRSLAFGAPPPAPLRHRISPRLPAKKNPLKNDLPRSLRLNQSSCPCLLPLLFPLDAVLPLLKRLLGCKKKGALPGLRVSRIGIDFPGLPHIAKVCREKERQLFDISGSISFAHPLPPPGAGAGRPTSPASAGRSIDRFIVSYVLEIPSLLLHAFRPWHRICFCAPARWQRSSPFPEARSIAGFGKGF